MPANEAGILGRLDKYCKNFGDFLGPVCRKSCKAVEFTSILVRPPSAAFLISPLEDKQPQRTCTSCSSTL